MQWRIRATDPLKTLCNPCSYNRYGDNPLYKKARAYVKKDANKKLSKEPLSEREKRILFEKKHPKYPCMFCKRWFRKDRHKKIKKKDGSEGYCNHCAKENKEAIARQEGFK